MTSDAPFIRSHCNYTQLSSLSPYMVFQPQNRRVLHDDAATTDLYFVGGGGGQLTHTRLKLPAAAGTKSRNLFLDSSCDGLLCFRQEPTATRPDWQSYLICREFFFASREIYQYLICNPLSRGGEWTAVPGGHNCSGLVVAFYFHPSAGEHRLLWRTHRAGRKSGRYAYKVHALGTDTWRRIQGSHLRLGGNSISLLGRIYTVPQLSPASSAISFAVDSEEFETVPLPGTTQQDDRIHLFKMEEDKLGLCHIRLRETREMGIYVLLDDPSSKHQRWKKLYVLPIPGDIFAGAKRLACLPARNEGELFLFTALGVATGWPHRGMALCNLKHKTWTKVDGIDALIPCKEYFDCYAPYTESLLPCKQHFDLP